VIVPVLELSVLCFYVREIQIEEKIKEKKNNKTDKKKADHSNIAYESILLIITWVISAIFEFLLPKIYTAINDAHLARII